jgi:hypothetical protein
MCHFESIYKCSFVCIFRGGIGRGVLVGEIILVLLQVFSKVELVADLPIFSLLIGSRIRQIRLSKFSTPGVPTMMGSGGGIRVQMILVNLWNSQSLVEPSPRYIILPYLPGGIGG